MTRPTESHEDGSREQNLTDDPDVDHDKIARVLRGEADTTILSEREEEIWADAFVELMRKPTEEEIAFFAERERQRLERLADGKGQDTEGETVIDEFAGTWPDDDENWPD